MGTSFRPDHELRALGEPSKIALFLHTLAGGGAERICVTLANAFADRGHPVDLVLVRAVGPYLTSLSPKVRIVDLAKGRAVLSLLDLARYLRRERPAAVLSALNYINVLAILAGKFSLVGTRIVISEHGVVASGDFASLRGWATLRLMRSTYRKADRIIGVSEGVADELAVHTRISRHLIDVVYNPVVSAELFRLAGEPLEHRWFAPGSPPVVIGAGRLTKQKDFGSLIAAFAKVRQSRLCRLVILGDGELRADLEKEVELHGVSADVLMPGFVDNPYAWLRRADVFVLSSLYEGLPTVLIEAMACGTRVVSTDCPSGPAEILDRGRLGTLVPVGDIAALADAIGASLDRPRDAALVERAGFFSVERSVDRYLTLLLGP